MRLFDVQFSDLDYDQVLDWILRTPPAGCGTRLLATANIDHIVNLQKNERFRRAYDAAALITIDGAPVVRVARMIGLPANRITGADLCRDALARLSPDTHRPFFVAPSPTTVKALARALSAQGFRSDQFGTEVPPYGFEKHAAFGRALADRIRGGRYTHLFMAVGAPKSEIWIHEHALGDITALAIGAGLDLALGLARRAPVVVQRLGLEWTWRLAQEPRRLFRRYFFGGIAFSRIAITELRRRGALQ